MSTEEPPFRWVASVKAGYVRRVLKGEITFREAMADSGASDAELALWFIRYGQDGKDGLKTTRCQDFRSAGDVAAGIVERLGRGRV